ncbi:MAG: LTA synthase family protein [Clostridia bacterium]|nr:LTA synthase family protein [Clostridia bacterium]
MNRREIMRPDPPKGFVYQVLGLGLLSCGLNYLIEALSRHSLWEASVYQGTLPLAFLYNSLILGCTLCPALLFRRKRFVIVLISTFWLILGIINCIVNIIRITPLGFYDFVIWTRNTSISNAYVTVWQMILIGIGLAAVTGCMVVVFRRAPKSVPDRPKALLLVFSVWILGALCTVPYAYAYRDYSHPAQAYRDYGFPYSLLRSAADRGISRPENYARETISQIVPDTQSAAETAPESKQPNFIFLQLESFLAPDNITTVRLSENPVPAFTSLREKCTGGYLYVPMIGGGTANVEFEVITGMNLNDFGTGEYPYSTVMQEAVCESAAYDLKELGYRAHAIHSNTATFYDRHLVFPRLGFDTFTSLEYMEPYETNSLGWCEDKWLTKPILDALSSDAEPDLIFAIAVQGHGKYNTDPPEQPYAIFSDGLEDNLSLKNAFEYYINQLKETDAFLSELTEILEQYPEPVVLIVYGDHLPALDFPAESLKSGSLLATEYVIWTNNNCLEKENRDLTSYQLTAYTLGRFGISNGMLMRFHQQRRQDEDYLTDLHQLEYDMLYGDQYLYNGQNPYMPTDMQMGIRQILTDSAVYDGKALIVRGSNYTRSSVIYASDRALDTIFVDGGTLAALPGLLDRIDGNTPIFVAQSASDGTILSVTNSIMCSTR